MYREQYEEFLHNHILNFEFEYHKLTLYNVYKNIGYRSFQTQLASIVFFNYLTSLLFGIYGIYFGSIISSKFIFNKSCCFCCDNYIPDKIKLCCFENNKAFDQCDCKCFYCCNYTKPKNMQCLSFNYFFHGCDCVENYCDKKSLSFQFIRNTCMFFFWPTNIIKCKDFGCIAIICCIPVEMLEILCSCVCIPIGLLLITLFILLVWIILFISPIIGFYNIAFFGQVLISLFGFSICKILLFIVLYPFKFCCKKGEGYTRIENESDIEMAIVEERYSESPSLSPSQSLSSSPSQITYPMPTNTHPQSVMNTYPATVPYPIE
jgi:hypothetical protein